MLPVLMLTSVTLFGQAKITQNIISIDTHERNSKKILFEKQSSSDYISFVLKAENKSSKDFTKCKWITFLSKEELNLKLESNKLKFIKELFF